MTIEYLVSLLKGAVQEFLGTYKNDQGDTILAMGLDGRTPVGCDVEGLELVVLPNPEMADVWTSNCDDRTEYTITVILKQWDPKDFKSMTRAKHALMKLSRRPEFSKVAEPDDLERTDDYLEQSSFEFVFKMEGALE